jgi:hypothetical protein
MTTPRKNRGPILRGPVRFDCPWTGHVADPRLRIRNSQMPNLIGVRCVKCGALIYEFIEASAIVGPGGEALPKPPAPEEGA